MIPVRRSLLKGGASLGALIAAPAVLRAQTSTSTDRRFEPLPGQWRTFDITTRVELADPVGPTRVWLPVPSINTDWQQSLESSYQSNGSARMLSDGVEGARVLFAEFADGVKPVVEITSRVRTRNRADLTTPARAFQREDAATLRHYTRATALLPVDGIVRQTALKATQGAKTDADKARAIYDWVVANAWREPKVRGCGEGDIKTMLETGNLGGKCADINALFVGLCRSVGVPARDVYGIRLVPSAFGYKELSGNPASLKGAQHCRAEVYLQAHGWVAMDPADVAKVMRLETPEWLKSTSHGVVAPVYKHLFGGWEGNWLGWNTAHDLKLPGAKEGMLNFLMYPVAETSEGRVDSYAPDSFKYTISAKEIIG
ncbi:transglutaminase-like domain-containing protein [Limnohabitans radicicola]|uniref:Transglutaminase domain-containing protein n=1 Tax=Limnohabitans radicicola TaxID=2771427 RepID=A0A927FIR9_9BURK|nr:transglutaminase domain-containing protein [Limnohabitans radicicola]MBD8050803.1 transglutaminase domain-containing protein [Limnohabitans radicicola]